MGKKNRKSDKKVDVNNDVAFDNPFANLATLKDALPVGEPIVDEPTPKTMPKYRVSISKKGRRGKTVTLIEGIGEEERPALTKLLGKKLGTGTSVEDTTIVVQGNQTSRIDQLIRDYFAD